MTKILKPLTKGQKIKHIEKGNESVLIMTLPQEEIVKKRLTFLGGSSSPAIFLKGEDCFNSLWEFFMSFTGQLIRPISEELAGNFYRGTVLESEIAKVYEFGERINKKYDDKGRLISFEISNKNLEYRIKNKVNSCKLYNYEKTLLKNIDPDKTDCIIGVTLDRLIIEDDMSNTLLMPDEYPYLTKPRYALGVLEIKSVNERNFIAEDGTILPVINLLNIKNIHLQYLMQVQNQMYQSNTDYADLISSSLSTHIVHRRYRDDNLMLQALEAYKEFWQDAIISRSIYQKVKILEELFDNIDELDKHSQEEQDMLSVELQKFSLDLENLNRKYVTKEFLSDKQYKEYFNMSFTPRDLSDLTDFIKDNKLKLKPEELKIYQDRADKLLTLIERKKELDYVKKEYENTTNDIKFNLGSFTSIKGSVDIRDKNGVLIESKIIPLVTYNPTKDNTSKILRFTKNKSE